MLLLRPFLRLNLHETLCSYAHVCEYSHGQYLSFFQERHHGATSILSTLGLLCIDYSVELLIAECGSQQAHPAWRCCWACPA